MIMTVVTAKVAVEQQVAAAQTVKTAPMIGHLMDLNAVIQLGMNMVLIVPHLKATIAGIVQVVTAQVMQRVNVVMVLATVMKTVKAALQTVANAATVRMAI